MSESSNVFLFAGHAYYACGGWNDFVSSHASIEDAEAAIHALKERQDWAHIVQDNMVVSSWLFRKHYSNNSFWEKLKETT